MLHRVSHTTRCGTREPTFIHLLSTTLYLSFRVSPLCRQPFPSHRQPDLIPIDMYLTLKHGYDRNGGVPILDTYRIWVLVKYELSTYLFFCTWCSSLVRLGAARYSTKKTFATKKMQKRRDKRCSDEDCRNKDGVMKIWSLAAAVACKISKQ